MSIKACIVIPATLVDEKLYDITLRFINSIDKRTTYENYEVLLYDNNSDTKLTEKLIAYINTLNNKDKFKVKILTNYRFNLSQVYNMALKDSDAELFIDANNDMEIMNEEWLANIIKWFEITPKLGMCIPYQDIIGNPLIAKSTNILYDSGDMCWFAIYGITRKALIDIGGHDEKVDLYYHDFDIFNAIKRKGYIARWAFNSIVKHYGDRTTINHPETQKHNFDSAHEYVHKKYPGK